MGLDGMKIEYTGLTKLTENIDKLGAHSKGLARGSLGAAAGVTADEYRRAIESIPTEAPGKNGASRWATPEHPLVGITPAEKQDLLNAIGIATFQDAGSEVNTSISVTGYGSIPTKRWPQGVPNAVLLRSVESGTTFRRKTPVVRRAKTAAARKATEAAQKKLDELAKKLIGD